MQKFGHELLSKHWKVEAGMLTGRAADSVLVLLKLEEGDQLDNSQF